MVRKLRAFSADVIVGLLLLGAMTGPAQAYLDPGTGAMILQIVLGGIAGAAVVLRLYWSKIKDFLGRGRVQQKAAEGRQDDDIS